MTDNVILQVASLEIRNLIFLYEYPKSRTQISMLGFLERETKKNNSKYGNNNSLLYWLQCSFIPSYKSIEKVIKSN